MSTHSIAPYCTIKKWKNKLLEKEINFINKFIAFLNQRIDILKSNLEQREQIDLIIKKNDKIPITDLDEPSRASRKYIKYIGLMLAICSVILILQLTAGFSLLIFNNNYSKYLIWSIYGGIMVQSVVFIIFLVIDGRKVTKRD